MKTRFPCTGLAYTVENVTATVQQIELRQRLSKRCDIAGAVIDILEQIHHRIELTCGAYSFGLTDASWRIGFPWRGRHVQTRQNAARL